MQGICLFIYLLIFHITSSSACQMVDIAVNNTGQMNGWMHTRWRDGSGFLPGEQTLVGLSPLHLLPIRQPLFFLLQLLDRLMREANR